MCGIWLIAGAYRNERIQKVQPDEILHAGSNDISLWKIMLFWNYGTVARTPEFTELAHDIAMQVASMAPQYVGDDDVPEEADEVPAEKILLEQAFIKDPSKTVRDLVAEVAARVRENVRVRRFSRFELGE